MTSFHVMYRPPNPGPAGSMEITYQTKEPKASPLDHPVQEKNNAKSRYHHRIAIILNIHLDMSICSRSKMATLFFVILSQFPNIVLEEWEDSKKKQSITTGEDLPWGKMS
eukprot:13585921-Ditylum_brightwellii.AAC.1